MTQPNQGYIKTRSASRFVVALVMVLLVAVSSSWSACVKERFTFTRSSYNCDECGSAPNCSTPIETGGYFRLGGREISTPQCLYLDAFTWDCPSRHYWITGVECEYTYRCKTQAEADSLAHIINCQNNPLDPSCKVEKDTTIIACNENIAPDGTTYSQIYDCSCKALDGQLTSCGGSTSVVPSRDCRLIKEKQGACSKNGYQVGANSGTHQNLGECYAVVGSRCYFEDPQTKNTFSCECDGSCSYGLLQLAQGSCKNPYFRGSSSSGDTLSFSSSSVAGSSSSNDDPMSSGGGVSSSGTAPQDSSGDLEYDYYAELGNIIANTQLINYNVEALNVKANKTNEHLESIDNKMTINNDLLNQIANKDFSPQVNVNVSSDTAKSPALILNKLNGLIDTGEVDTNDLLGGLNIGRLQNEQDSLQRFWDTKTDIFANCDTTGGKDCSNIFGLDSSRTTQELRTAFNSLMDTLQNGAFGDSVKKWQSYLMPSALSGSGSNTCPAILQKSFPVAIGGISFTIPSLGSTGLCGTMIGGLTFWAFVRLLLRLFVGFACLFAVYRCVVGLGEDK